MIEIQGLSNAFYTAEVNAGNSLMFVRGTPAWPASGGTSGGFYSVTGGLSAVIGASLASGTTLMSSRFSTSSTRKAYVTKIRINMGASTLATSASIAGSLGLQRFTSATPTGGTARTVNRQSEISGNTSNMTDIRDNNAGLTMTSVVFGAVAGSSLVPLFIQTGFTANDWIFEPSVPLVLNPGDGICLRTQTNMPATQTWIFSYSMYWFEE